MKRIKPVLFLTALLLAILLGQAAPQYQGDQYRETLSFAQFLKKYPAVGNQIASLSGWPPTKACEGSRMCLIVLLRHMFPGTLALATSA